MLVLARRHLLLGLALTLAIATALGLAGADPRSPLPGAAAAVALAGAAAAARRRVTVEDAARVLDRGLALRERLRTALELTAGAGGARGLGPRVVEEAARRSRRACAARGCGRRRRGPSGRRSPGSPVPSR